VAHLVIIRPALAVEEHGAAKGDGHLKRSPSRVLLKQVAAITKPLGGDPPHIMKGTTLRG
jgi:hypothetical protein